MILQNIVLIFLYVSVYLSIGAIFAEVGLASMKSHGVTVNHRKGVYVLASTLWPLCFVIVLHHFFTGRKLSP